MTELKVLGIGSPFGDDSLGWEVVTLLQQQAKLKSFTPERLQFIYCDRPGLHVLELLHDTKAVFLIDAIKSGGVAGSLFCLKNEEIEEVTATNSTHALGIGYALKMGKALNILPKEVVLYGIEIEDVLFQFKLSTSMMHAIVQLSVQVQKDIISFLG